MQALVYHGPHQMRWEEWPDPQPGPGDDLLEVLAVGICGSDVHGYTGQSGRRQPPMVMGHEVAGRVAAVGDQTPLERVGIQDEYSESATNDDLAEKHRLTAPHIAAAARRVLQRKRDAWPGRVWRGVGPRTS